MAADRSDHPGRASRCMFNSLLSLLQVYLPHGAYVKVSTSGQLINVWVVPSPSDLYMTEGARSGEMFVLDEV